MQASTHLAFGVVVGLVFLIVIPVPGIDGSKLTAITTTTNDISSAFLFLFLVVCGSILPDIDHHGSLVGKRIKIVAWFFTHRGIWHSLLVPTILLGLGWYLFPSFWYQSIALSLGFFSHLLLDGLTPRGVRLFYPLSNYSLRGFLRTGGALETVLFVGLLVTIGWLLGRLW